MEIAIGREWKKKGYTISRVYIDGVRFGDGKAWCSCLEDEDRGLTQDMPIAEIRNRKVKGQTAIPSGEYTVVVTWSPRFKRDMPLVENVPGFEGIRLHSGNDAGDTEGCLLWGENTVVGKVLNSRYWTGLLEERISAALKRGGTVRLKIG